MRCRFAGQRSQVAVAVACLFAHGGGCSLSMDGESDGADITERDFPSRFAQVECAAYTDCGCFPFDDCEATREEMLIAEQAEAQALQLTFSVEQAGLLASWISSCAPRTSPAPNAPLQRKFYFGNGAEADPCSTVALGDTCLPGLLCREWFALLPDGESYGVVGNRCVDPHARSGAGGGDCNNYECDDGLYCDRAELVPVCRELDPGKCKRDGDCAQGEYCVDEETSNLGECSSRKQIGESCSHNEAACVAGAYCESTSYTCETIQAIGEPCGFGACGPSASCDANVCWPVNSGCTWGT